MSLFGRPTQDVPGYPNNTDQCSGQWAPNPGYTVVAQTSINDSSYIEGNDPTDDGLVYEAKLSTPEYTSGDAIQIVVRIAMPLSPNLNYNWNIYLHHTDWNIYDDFLVDYNITITGSFVTYTHVLSAPEIALLVPYITSGNLWLAASWTHETDPNSRVRIVQMYLEVVPQVPHVPNAIDDLVSSFFTWRKIDLNWSDPESGNVDGYIIERNIDGEGWVVIDTIDDITYRDVLDQDVLIPGIEICYRVTAFNDLGDSDPSNKECETLSFITKTSSSIIEPIERDFNEESSDAEDYTNETT